MQNTKKNVNQEVIKKMDKVKQFDKELKNIYEDVFWGGKVCTVILCGIGMVFMLFPVSVMDDRIWLMWLGCIQCAGGVIQYMQAYLGFRENGKMTSIYKKLEFMPVTKAQIRKVRCAYLNHICVRLGAAAFIIQQLASLLSHSFGWKSVLFAIAWVFCVWLIGWIVLYTS